MRILLELRFTETVLGADATLCHRVLALLGGGSWSHDGKIQDSTSITQFVLKEVLVAGYPVAQLRLAMLEKG